MARINYSIATWSGSRRKGNDDPCFYLRAQLASLTNFKHNLTQITIAVPENPSESEAFSAALSSFPDRIQNADVKILRRPNIGQSYGSYYDIYRKYSDTFDYYIFMEDDYIFVENKFDTILVEEYEKSGCGYLCGLVLPFGGKPHAAISNGIASSAVLKKVSSLWSKSSFSPNRSKKTIVGVNYSCISQLEFSWAFLDTGHSLADLTESYSIPFNTVGKLKIFGKPNNPKLSVPTQCLKDLGYPELYIYVYG